MKYLKPMTTTEMTSIFIPPIIAIIEDYMAKDYRFMYECVMRDMNWFAPWYAEGICANNNMDGEIEYTEGEWLELFPVIWFDQYTKVMLELDRSNDVNTGVFTYARFMK